MREPPQPEDPLQLAEPWRERDQQADKEISAHGQGQRGRCRERGALSEKIRVTWISVSNLMHPARRVSPEPSDGPRPGRCSNAVCWCGLGGAPVKLDQFSDPASRRQTEGAPSFKLWVWYRVLHERLSFLHCVQDGV